jgi:tripartite-type tricarboxylate transporter receptor subunit TctC
MSMQRRELLVAASLLAAQPSWAVNDFPEKPIRLILPFPPGSTSDILARYICEKVSKVLGQPVIVESKPGAQGAIAARQVAKSAADGYTIFFGTNSTHAANVYLINKLGYDPLKDFTPITQCATNPLVLVVNTSLPVRSVHEFVTYAKERKGQLSYGSGNTGSLVAAHLFNTAAGIDAVGVNYPGVAQACSDLVGGRLEFMLVDPPVVRPFIEAGKLKVLGITTKQRLASLPDVAPLAELGLPNFSYASWAGFFAPANIPTQVLQKLHAAFDKVLREPETAQYMSSLGIILERSTPDDFAAFVKNQVHLWGQLVRSSGLQAA